MYFEADIDYCRSSGHGSGFFWNILQHESGITGGSDVGTNEKKKKYRQVSFNYAGKLLKDGRRLVDFASLCQMIPKIYCTKRLI